MKEIIHRRVVPVSMITIACFAALALFQLFVFTGGFEIKSETVRRVAPWAYDAFIRIAGEHPDTRPVWAASGAENEPLGGPSAMAEVAGLGADTEEPSAKAVIEPSKPVDEPAAVIPVIVPEESEEEPVDEDVPVG